ncbi:SHOCT domain-containing protein [Actinomadura sp. GC306]|uniref:SHOCT domain-containing protein n=1 Tax=Actinomadura sp. GC306 TaxID=2530367 RepID=UPI0010532E45|nr:SHOCT domain-containing protein [Actinomadura sp. GC306]TDC61982.1 SHOCT domain-containing protein [Actinomadura sp. GC306]
MLTTLITQLGPGGWHDGGDAPAYWPVFPIAIGLFWLAVLGAAFYLIRRRMTGTAAVADPMGKARSVLAERFARGEIDEDEYLRRAATLRNGD